MKFATVAVLSAVLMVAAGSASSTTYYETEIIPDSLLSINYEIDYHPLQGPPALEVTQVYASLSAPSFFLQPGDNLIVDYKLSSPLPKKLYTYEYQYTNDGLNYYYVNGVLVQLTIYNTSFSEDDNLDLTDLELNIQASTGTKIYPFTSPVNVDGGYYYVDVTTAPEPSTWTLMMMGLAGLGAATRLRRREITA